VNTLQENDWLRVVPLGGLGHIGGNMMVYETAQDLIMVDAGVLFPTTDQPGIDYVIPDIAYVLEPSRRHKLRGIVLTHGHEDHIGALPYVLPELGAVPLWATPFTAALIRNKLGEFPDVVFDLQVIKDRQKVKMGAFVADFLAVTHSIPHSAAIALKTPIGTVIHTGDYKIDDDPLDGRKTDIAGFKAYGDAGVALLCSDSTNAERPGHTLGERVVSRTLEKIVKDAPHRVFLTTFASHVDRMQSVMEAARLAGRKVIPLGRSMQQNISLALELGVLKVAPGVLAEASDFTTLPRNKVVVLASGSQGEPMSSMMRIAHGRLAPIVVEPGDQVIMSSRRIPGNELAIGTMVNHLFRMGAEVIDDHMAKVHSSGHGFNDESQQMLQLCRPKAFVPLHGEFRHMVRHAAVARAAGVRADRTYVTEDGHPLLFRRDGDDVVAERLGKVPSGLVFVDGKGIGDVGEIVLRDRRLLAESGIVCCVLVLSSDSRIVMAPQLASRGLIYVDENLDLMKQATQAVARALNHMAPSAEPDDFSEEIRGALRKFFRKELDRKPMVVPVVIRLPRHCCD
jgi:ribonuclease J